MKKLLEIIEKLFSGIGNDETISIPALERELKDRDVQIPESKKKEIDEKSFPEKRRGTSSNGGHFTIPVLEKSKIMDILKK